MATAKPAKQEELPPGLGARIDRALTVEELLSLMAESARINDTPESHRKMDDVLVRLVKLLAAGNPKAQAIRDILRRYERADRWFG